MPIQEKQEAYLEKCVQDYDFILIDTCSLMSPGAHAFWQHILPFTRRYGKKIIVPMTVWNELNNNQNDPRKDAATRKAAHDAWVEVSRLNDDREIIIAGTQQEMHTLSDPAAGDGKKPFADNVFLSVLMNLRMEFDTLTITQDRGLTLDILGIGRNTNAVRVPKKVHVRGLTPDGYLRLPTVTLQSGMGGTGGTGGMGGGPRPRAAQGWDKSLGAYGTGEPFAKVTVLQDIPGKMTLLHRPAPGETITAEYGDGRRETLRLGDEIARGGEGAVHRTDHDGLVAKIYFPRMLKCMVYEKLKRMVAHRIECRGVCFPKALVYNSAHEFCGYLMDEAKGKPMDISVYRLWKLQQQKDPANPMSHWTKIDTVQLAITILEKICFLHRMNIIIGDLNPTNILVVSPTEVYFVDTDSYQIEGFPCPVGWKNFTPRELLLKSENLEYGSFLRTEGNENFAIAVLLFTIMVPGKMPYSAQGSTDQRENIIKGEFPYPLGKKSTGTAPKGQWPYCWSQLPYTAMKEPFYQTFCLENTSHSSESTRYSAQEWLNNFRAYRQLLTKDKGFVQNDEQALMIFPTHYKHQAGVTYAHCSVCGREFPADKLRSGHCYECRKKTYRTITCADCGKAVDITYATKDFFDSQGWDLPKRCESCQRIHKLQKERRKYEQRRREAASRQRWDRPSAPQKRAPEAPREAPVQREAPQGFWDHIFDLFR